MFCSNCGNKLEGGDEFCSNCGYKVSSRNTSVSSSKMIDFDSENIKKTISSYSLVKILKKYFINPLSFIKDFKGKELTRPVIELLISLSIINGFLNIFYTSTFIRKVFNVIKKLPNILVKSGVISPNEYLNDFYTGNIEKELTVIRTTIENYIDYKSIFFSGVARLLIMIVLTGIILLVVNAILLKGKNKIIDLFFLSCITYMPFVIASLLGTLATYISILFGWLIIISGIILSFITLFNGLKEISEETEDKVFITVAVTFIIFAIIASIFVATYVPSNISDFINKIKAMDSI